MQLKPSPGKWHSRKQIEAAQQELLREHLAYCKNNSPYYRSLLASISPETFTLDALTQLPFTDKTGFAEHNERFMAVPLDEIVDIVLSSGTTGKQTPVRYTERDLQRLAYNEAISFAACGVTRADTALLTCTIDRCFVAGLAYQIGLRQLGAAVIRNGASTLPSHLEIIRSLKPTLLVGVPTFLRKLGRHLRENGIDPAATTVRKLVCIGEPLRDEGMNLLKLGAELEEIWNSPVYSTYASSEAVSTFCECTARNGGHLHPELAIVEIVDPEGNRLPPGEHGEVVLTPLQTQGMPLIRFKTGDISFLIDEPCACGRVTPRLGPILGRKCQMLKTKGTSIYPLAVLDALNSMPGVVDYYVTVTSEETLSDHLTVHAAVAGDVSREHLMERLQARLRVKTDVVIEPETAVQKQVFGSGSRKPVRFVDQRIKS